jgi:hypothetical protein
MDAYTIITLLVAIAIVVALIVVLKYYRIEVPTMPDLKDIPDNVVNMLTGNEVVEPEPEEA